MKYRWACGPDSSDLSLCVSGKETGNHQVPCICQSRPIGYLFSPGVSLTLNYLIGLSRLYGDLNGILKLNVGDELHWGHCMSSTTHKDTTT